MSKIILAVTIASTLLIAGCETNNGSHPNQTNSTLIGEWLTDACQQTTNLSGEFLNDWWKGVYIFSSEGTVVTKYRVFSNSNCSGNYSLLSVPNNEPALEYSDLGEETLQEGMQGNRIRVNFTVENKTGVVEGFYLISNNALCFSSNIILSADSITLSGAGNTTIDFEKCLTRLP